MQRSIHRSRSRHRADRRPRAVLPRIAAMAIAALLVVAGLATGAPQPARAATTGAGFEGITPYGGFLGNYVAPDGTRAYCMDSGREWPAGATGGAQAVASLTTDDGLVISGATLRKFNYVLSEYGQTADAVRAAAVDAYIYAYASHYGHANPGVARHDVGSHFINGRADVHSAYNAIWNDAEAHFDDEQNAPKKPAVTLTFSTDKANDYKGTLRVAGLPSGTTADVRLTGGVFTSSGKAQNPRLGNGSVAVTGTAAAGVASYRISATAAVSVGGGHTYASNVVVYSTGAQQRILRGGATVSVTHDYSFSGADAAARAAVFSPTISATSATQYLSAGTASSDRLTVTVADATHPWRLKSDGTTGETVVATGTLYGPMAASPKQGAAVPAGTPATVAVTQNLTGPGAYTVTVPAGRVAASGFYTWVWTIEAARQSTAVRALLPTNYRFSTDYGIAAETGVHPWNLAAQSKVSDEAVGLGRPSHDTLTVALHGATGWPSIGGKPIELAVTDTVYFWPHVFAHPGEALPGSGGTVPSDARVISSYSTSLAAAGTIVAPPVVAPAEETGFIVHLWSAATAAAGTAYFTPWNDAFGTAGEYTRVLAPTVATTAIGTIARRDLATDTATIGGLLPADATLNWAAYRAPADPSAEARCDTSTLLWPRVDPTDAAVPLDRLGDYVSPEVEFDAVGRVAWLATVRSPGGTVLAQDACGEASEITEVADDALATTATARVELGGGARDVASLSGTLPVAATISWEVFERNSAEANCDDEHRVFTTIDDATPVSGEGDYASATFTPARVGTYDWVATVRNARGTVTERGECGDADEVTIVTAPPSPATHPALDDDVPELETTPETTPHPTRAAAPAPPGITPGSTPPRNASGPAAPPTELARTGADASALLGFAALGSLTIGAALAGFAGADGGGRRGRHSGGFRPSAGRARRA